mgnify:CR=1 FL=1
MRAVVASLGEAVITLAGLEGLDAQELWVHPSDQHPNERVHEIAGRAVSEALEGAL